MIIFKEFFDFFKKQIYKRLSLSTLKDKRLRGDLIEIYKVISSRESIQWVKSLNLKGNGNISVPAMSVRGNSLSMRRQSF